MKPTFILALAASVTLSALARAGEPSEAQIKKALEKNPDLVLDVLRSHKKEFFDLVQEAAQEEQTRRQKEAQEAEEKAFETSFKNPFKPSLDAKTHLRGNKDAKYTLVEYSDFQCPYCSRGYQVVEALRKKYGSDLRFTFKNMPLPFHPMAMPAAQYFEAAALQSADKAWTLHDKMFENQANLSEDFIKKTAKELGLDLSRLEKDVKGDAVKAKIEADINEAKGFDFTGTPGFLLNGIPVRGAYPVEKFDSIIERLKENSKKG